MVSWKFCIKTREQLALKFCLGNLYEGNGWGFDRANGDFGGDGFGSGYYCRGSNGVGGSGNGFGNGEDYEWGVGSGGSPKLWL